MFPLPNLPCNSAQSYLLLIQFSLWFFHLFWQTQTFSSRELLQPICPPKYLSCWAKGFSLVCTCQCSFSWWALDVSVLAAFVQGSFLSQKFFLFIKMYPFFKSSIRTNSGVDSCSKTLLFNVSASPSLCHTTLPILTRLTSSVLQTGLSIPIASLISGCTQHLSFF